MGSLGMSSDYMHRGSWEGSEQDTRKFEEAYESEAAESMKHNKIWSCIDLGFSPGPATLISQST